jgi:hypothetical protein
MKKREQKCDILYVSLVEQGGPGKQKNILAFITEKLKRLKIIIASIS